VSDKDGGHDTGASPNKAGRIFRWTLAILIALTVAVVHWLTAAHIDVGQWAKGAPSTLSGYLPVAIAVLLLILPEIQEVGIGGFRLELRHQREEIGRIAGQVQDIQNSQVQIAASQSSAGHMLNLFDPKMVAALADKDPAALNAILANLKTGADSAASEAKREADQPVSAVDAFAEVAGAVDEVRVDRSASPQLGSQT
jgi:hypothetical protein